MDSLEQELRARTRHLSRGDPKKSTQRRLSVVVKCNGVDLDCIIVKLTLLASSRAAEAREVAVGAAEAVVEDKAAVAEETRAVDHHRRHVSWDCARNSVLTRLTMEARAQQTR